jgi:hypothetical protein
LSDRHGFHEQLGRRARPRTSWVAALAALLPLLWSSRVATAQPHSLGAELWGQLEPNVGLIVIEGSTRKYPYVEAEGLVWAGAGTPQFGLRDNQFRAEALVLNVKVRDPKGVSDTRLGRFILATGAVRAMHVDGGHAILRAPSRTNFELFGGVPVEGDIEGRRYDWVAGGRISQGLGKKGVIGASYYNRYNAGQRSDEEVGADFALRAAHWLDVAAKFSWEIVNSGLAEVLGSISSQIENRRFRAEAFVTKRSPTRLLQQTSLFTVLGDPGTLRTGANLFGRAAPRLDFWVEGAAHQAQNTWGWSGYFRSVLRTDDEGKGSVLGEIRRQAIPNVSHWTGLRLAADVPIFTDMKQTIVIGPELELIIPDEREPDTGTVWPWGRLAVRWTNVKGWTVAAAGEASSNQNVRVDVRALARVAYQHTWRGER